MGAGKRDERDERDGAAGTLNTKVGKSAMGGQKPKGADRQIDK
jgi:hypothetical protein